MGSTIKLLKIPALDCVLHAVEGHLGEEHGVHEDAQRPGLQLGPSVAVPLQHLRAAVVQGAEEVGEGGLLVLGEVAGRAEVDEFDSEPLVDDDVLVLDVAVEHALEVEEGDG